MTSDVTSSGTLYPMRKLFFAGVDITCARHNSDGCEPGFNVSFQHSSQFSHIQLPILIHRHNAHCLSTKTEDAQRPKDDMMYLGAGVNTRAVKSANAFRRRVDPAALPGVLPCRAQPNQISGGPAADKHALKGGW